MRRRFLRTLLAALPFGWIGLGAGATAKGRPAMQDPSPDHRDSTVASFEMAELAARQAAGGRAYLPFFENRTLRMGLYVLPAGAKDDQSPHEQDEVYVINEGRAVLQVDGADQPVAKGSIVFVRARAAHHFHSIEEDLSVLVFFSTAEPGP